MPPPAVGSGTRSHVRRSRRTERADWLLETLPPALGLGPDRSTDRVRVPMTRRPDRAEPTMMPFSASVCDIWKSGESLPSCLSPSLPARSEPCSPVLLRPGCRYWRSARGRCAEPHASAVLAALLTAARPTPLTSASMMRRPLRPLSRHKIAVSTCLPLQCSIRTHSVRRSCPSPLPVPGV